MSVSSSFWQSFAQDPRDVSHAPLRASDADREVVRQLLAESYADGRLDREEYDERSDGVIAARTLGELPALVADLVPDRPVVPVTSRASLVSATPDDLARLALESWETHRRQAVLSFLGPTLICWAVWLAVGFGGTYAFPWPLIVMAATGFHAARTLASKKEYLAEEVQRLEKKQAKALRPKNTGGAGGAE